MSAPSAPEPSSTASAATDSPPGLTPDIVAFATKVYNAARSGDLPLFQQALPRGLPANMTNEKGDSLLMLSCYHGHYDVAKFLLENGADPNRVNDRGQSIIAGAVFKKEEAIVDLLLEWGADVDLGEPSASQAVSMFRMEGDWAQKFEDARRRKKAGASGEGGGGAETSSRGQKGEMAGEGVL